MSASAGPSPEWWQPSGPKDVAAPAISVATGTDSRYSRWAFGALVAFLLVNLVSPQSFVPALEVLRPALLCALVAAGAHFLEGFSGAQTNERGQTPLEVRIVLGIVGWAALTIPMSIWPGGSFADLLLFLRLVLFFWLMTRIIRRPHQLRIVLWTLVAIAGLFAATALNHFRAGVYVNGSNRIAGFGTGAAADPNDLALFLVAFLPIAVALGLTTRNRFARWCAWGVVAICVVGVVVTFSRGGAIGLGVVVLWGVSIAARRGKSSLILLLAVVVVGGAAMAPSSYVTRLGAIGIDGDSSSQRRWNKMVSAVDYIGHHPLFGAGFSREIDALERAAGDWVHVHCSYLQIAVDLGLPGLALFIALIASGWYSALQMERDSQRAGQLDLAYLATGIRIGLTGYAVAAVFLPVAYSFPLYYLLAITATLPAGKVGATAVAARVAASSELRLMTGPVR